MTKDPVCGMEVDEKKAAASTTYHGKKFFFCSQQCKDTFEKEPERYAKAAEQKPVHSV